MLGKSDILILQKYIWGKIFDGEILIGINEITPHQTVCKSQCLIPQLYSKVKKIKKIHFKGELKVWLG